MPEQPAEPSSGERRCSRCGTAFTCGIRAGQAACWCFDLPHVMKMEDAGQEGCLCPACLKAQIAAIQKGGTLLGNQLGSNADD